MGKGFQCPPWVLSIGVASRAHWEEVFRALFGSHRLGWPQGPMGKGFQVPLWVPSNWVASWAHGERFSGSSLVPVKWGGFKGPWGSVFRVLFGSRQIGWPQGPMGKGF